MEDNPKAQEALRNAVEEQLQSPDSVFVKEAYDRLMAEGHERESVMDMLAAVLAVEMWEMSANNREFDQALYLERLNGLPEMGWLKEE